MLKNLRVSANILYGVTLFFWFSQYAYTPYLNPEMKILGTSASFMGLVGGVYGMTQLFLRFPVGIMADRWHNQKIFICLGTFLGFLAPVMMILIYHPVCFLIARALTGVAASSWVSFTVLYSSYFSGEKAASSVTMLNVGNQIGRLLSYLLGGVLVAQHGAKAAFFISAFGGAIAFTLSLFIKEPKISKEPIRFAQIPAVLKNRHLIITSIVAILVQAVAFSTFYSFTSNYAISIGAQLSQLSDMSIALIIPYILGNSLAGMYLMGRVRIKRLLVFGTVLMGIYCFALPSTQTMSVLYIWQMLAGFGFSLTLPVLLGVCLTGVEPIHKTTAMGFFQAVYSIGMTLGPVCMGLIVDLAGLSTGFYFMGMISLLAMVVCICFF